MWRLLLAIAFVVAVAFLVLAVIDTRTANDLVNWLTNNPHRR